MTSDTSPSATSLPGSEDGLTPCTLQDGQQVFPFGLEAAHANRFRAPESVRAKWTKGTSGQSGTNLLPSVALQRSLASKLRQRMDVNGSMEYRLIWKNWDMPSGRRICALRASERPTSDNAFSGWPTCQARDGKALTHNSLNEVAKLAGWGSPTASSPGGTPEQALERKKDHNCGQSVTLMEHQVQLTVWNTPHCPRENDSDNSNSTYMGREAKLAGWATPNAEDAKAGTSAGRQQKSLGQDAAMSSGDTPNTSTAETKSGGQLSPELARWCMGYPAEWGSCGATAMRLCRRSRKRSSR